MHCQDTKFAFLIIASEIQKRRLEHFEGFEPSSRQLTRVIGFIFSELCLPLFLGLQYCVFQEKYIILDILVGDDVVETSLPRYQHGVITVIRIAYYKNKMHANIRLYWIRTNVSSIAASALTN